MFSDRTTQPNRQRARTILRAGIYLLLMGAGITSIFLPPLSAIDLLDVWAPFTWGLLLVLGGLGGLLSQILDRWAYEYIGLIPAITGVMIYAVTVGGAMVNYPPTWTRATQLLIVLALAVSLIARLQGVHQRHVAPYTKQRRR